MLSLKNMDDCRQLRVQEKSFEYNPVLCHRRICFVSKEIFALIFKLLFAFALSVDQLSKVKMEDVLLINFQLKEGICLICLKILNISLFENQ